MCSKAYVGTTIEDTRDEAEADDGASPPSSAEHDSTNRKNSSVGASGLCTHKSPEDKRTTTHRRGVSNGPSSIVCSKAQHLPSTIVVFIVFFVPSPRKGWKRVGNLCVKRVCCCCCPAKAEIELLCATRSVVHATKSLRDEVWVLNFSCSSLSLVVDNQGISRRSLRPRLFSSLSSISVFIDILSTFFVVFVFAEQEEVVEEEVVKEEEDNESRIVGARSARERRSERIEVSTSTALFLFFFTKFLTRILTRDDDWTRQKQKGRRQKN